MTDKELLEKLDESTSLNDLQDYIVNMLEFRGFADESAQDILLMMMEEVGELARAVRKTAGLPMDANKHNNDESLPGEIADVFILLLSLCKATGIRLLDAFLEKEQLNCDRLWVKSFKR